MIIIKTPQPDTEERLVLVPVDACNEVREDDPRTKLGAKVGLTVFACHARDATPDDLGRAGYVLEAAGAEHVRAICAAAERPLLARVEKAEAHAAELHERCETLRVERNAAQDRAEKVERERDEAYRNAVAAMRERDEARAELARLTLVDEEEPTDEALRDAFAEGERNAKRVPIASALRVVYRLGVAHERARHDAKDRATDEELVAIGHEVGKAHIFDGVPEGRGNTWEAWRKECDLAIVRAVAARVRQERCLIAQAVAANVDVRVCEDNDGRFMVGVHATGCDEVLVREVPTADVPSALARLLGEVSRG